MRRTDKFTFFYGTNDPFSNWHPASFPENGITFLTSEHYMMYYKALKFGDTETAAQILAAPTPKEAKRLGRLVKGFDQSIWEGSARSIVYVGCYLKFTCNKHLLDILLGTKGTLLVEASPTDRVWGIGLAETDDRVLNPKNWRGTNWLGEVLTCLRDNLLNQITDNRAIECAGYAI